MIPCKLPNLRVHGEQHPRTYPFRGLWVTTDSLFVGELHCAMSHVGMSNRVLSATPSLTRCVVDGWNTSVTGPPLAGTSKEKSTMTRDPASSMKTYLNMSRSSLSIRLFFPSVYASTAAMSSPSSPSTWYTGAPASRRSSARKVSALRGMARSPLRHSASLRLVHFFAASSLFHPASMTK